VIVVDVKKAVVLVGKQIENLEQGLYLFENVIKPRAEKDRVILDELRQQFLKLQVLQEKLGKGEDVSQEEMYALVPASLR